jgi:broad specificity phosphatase PhoE
MRAALQNREFQVAAGFANKQQAAREAYEAATGGGGVPDFMQRYHPEAKYNAPFPGTDSTLQAAPRNEDVAKVADDYVGRALPSIGNLPINPDLGKRLADFAQEAQHNPNDPAVKDSYNALNSQIKQQYDAIQKAGYKIEPWTGAGEPYKSSAEMSADVRNNKHLFFLPTQGNFTGAENNLMLKPSGVEGLSNNDLFRAVHDFFGHAKEGLQFGPRGEYNAWREHSQMFTPEAQGALAAETLAQNAFVNFGKHLRTPEGNIPAAGEPGFVPPASRPFAEQKNFVVPPELRRAAQFQPIPPGAKALDWRDLGNDALHPGLHVEALAGKPPAVPISQLQQEGWKTMDFQDNGSFHDYDNRPIFYKDSTGKFPVTPSGVRAASDAASKAFDEAQKFAFEDRGAQYQPKPLEEAKQEPKTILIRHGTTALNNTDPTKDLIRGHKNVQLSDEGRQQAAELGKQLSNSGISRIYSSDLDRTMDTAKEVSKTTGAPVVPDARLRPWKLGNTIEGKPTADMLPKIKALTENPDQKPPGGETFNEFKNRFLEGYHEIQNAHPNEHTAIVTHYRGTKLMDAWRAAGVDNDEVKPDVFEAYDPHKKPGSYQVLDKQGNELPPETARQEGPVTHIPDEELNSLPGMTRAQTLAIEGSRADAQFIPELKPGQGPIAPPEAENARDWPKFGHLVGMWLSPDGSFHGASPNHYQTAEAYITGWTKEDPREAAYKKQWIRVNVDGTDHTVGIMIEGPKPNPAQTKALEQAADSQELPIVRDDGRVIGGHDYSNNVNTAQFKPREEKELELRHWSNVPGLKVLDPAFHGTGLSGDELIRKRDYADLYVPRTYFGTKDYTKEPGLGPEEYRAAVKRNKLYPFQEDPKDLWPTPEEVEAAGYAPMDFRAANTLYENKIAKAGYEGYIHRDAKVAAKFTKTPVQYIGGQYLPSTEPRAIRAAAVQDPETGDIHEGPMHFSAYQAATAAGVKSKDLSKMSEGFVTNEGEFLDRDQALKRAQEMNQLTSSAVVRNEPTLVSEDLNQFKVGAIPAKPAKPAAAQFKPAGAPKLEDFQSEDKIAKALARPGWSLLTATEEKKGPGTAPVNIKANAKLEDRLKELGYDFVPVAGSYKGIDQGQNFLVTGISSQDALALGKEFNQESVLTPHGLVYQDGSVHPAKPEETIVGAAAKKNDFYSQVAGGPAFSMGIDFENKLPPESAPSPVARPEQQMIGGAFSPTKELLSTKDVSDMSPTELKEHYPEALVVPDKENGKPAGVPSDIKESPLYKEAGTEEKAVDTFAKRLADFARQYKDNPAYKDGLRWYSEFVPLLKKHFGEHSQIMAELLAATSPQNNPTQNFAMANDALEMWKRGKFDKQLAKFEEGIKKLEDGSWKKSGAPTEAKFMSDWVDQHDLKPRQSNGKLYNMHSVPVLQVLARKWLENTGGPKTQNFVKNLLGTGHGATYDVWADRTLRRIGYSGHQARWRILPKNAVGVSDADFHFGQKVFAKAAKELGVRPDSLQGGLWFAEKQLWADNGWGRLDLGDFRKEIQNRELLNKGIAQRLATTEAAATAPKAEQGGFDLGDTAQYSPSMNEITKALGDIGELPGYAYRQLMDRARDNHRFGPDAGKYPDELNRGLALQYIAEQKARAPIIESRPLR